MAVIQNHLPVAENEELEKLKKAFLASLNHEIRTPVSGMLGLLDLLMDTPLTEEQKGYVATTKTCAEDLFRLLNATLEYAALESGQSSIDESEFSLKELVASGMGAEASKARSKGIELIASVDAGLPETLIGDAHRIKQVISHLLDNGVKFTTRGSVELKLSFDRKDGKIGELSITVRDTGIGIPAEERERIFDSFQQLDTGPARNYPGLGLGLTVSRRLVTFLGGTLDLQSEMGVGTKVRVRLPVRLPSTGFADGSPASRLGSSGIAPGRSPSAAVSILAVDDNAVGLTVIRRSLERHGVRTDTVLDGESAVRAASERRYDVILMDLQMPGMDGLQTTAAIRKVPGYENVPILALTADFSDETRIRCQRQGMQGFIAKPVESAVLWQTIQRFLKRS